MFEVAAYFELKLRLQGQRTQLSLVVDRPAQDMYNSDH